MPENDNQNHDAGNVNGDSNVSELVTALDPFLSGLDPVIRQETLLWLLRMEAEDREKREKREAIIRGIIVSSVVVGQVIKDVVGQLVVLSDNNTDGEENESADVAEGRKCSRCKKSSDSLCPNCHECHDCLDNRNVSHCDHCGDCGECNPSVSCGECNTCYSPLDDD